MPKKKTHEQFLKECKEKGILEKLEIIGQYKGTKEKIECRCKKHDYTWFITPSKLLSGQSCPLCACEKTGRVLKKTNEKFLQECKEKGVLNTVEILSPYVNAKTKILCHCKIHDYTWEATPDYLLTKKHCPICGEEIRRKTVMGKAERKLIQTLSEKFPSIKLVGEYKGRNKINTFYCEDCGSYFSTKPGSLINSKGCPICGDGFSFNERLLKQFIKMTNPDYYKFQFAPFWAQGRRYDCLFILNKVPYIVEVDGAQHFTNDIAFNTTLTLAERQEIDKFKEKCAKEHNIEVIRINCFKKNHTLIIEEFKMSKLTQIFNLKDFDWATCASMAEKSMIKIVCEFYNENKENMFHYQMAKELDMDINTFTKYLKDGNTYGWCDYVPRTNHKLLKHKLQVYDKNDNFLYNFNTVKECVDFFQERFGIRLIGSDITRVTTGKTKQHKGYKFKYLET